jgi:uncharacterized membrane protein YgaE (UPF0421/DUF939 family)
VAAALAWLLAHRVLGHQQPFFAPIAAAVALSTSRIQRLRRIVQLVGGVLLGIAVGELLSSAVGVSALALGGIVFVTLVIAVAVGAGFFAGGMMFANQAAASAILVVTLHKHGTGGERAIDALVGGGVSLVLGVLLFPAHPMTLLRNAERRLLAELATTIEQAVAMIDGSADSGVEWSLTRGAQVHSRLSELASVRATARANVRLAPRRWRLRPVVEAEVARLSRFDALADVVLAMARAAIRPFPGARPLPAGLRNELAGIGGAMRRLAASEQPWPALAVDSVRAVTRRAIERTSANTVDRAAVVGPLLHTAAVDLAAILGENQAVDVEGNEARLYS